MAHEEHLARLKQGIKAWNQWREADPNIKPDLTWTDFSGADLSGVDFSGVNLSQADLTGAELTGADLSEANLSGARLSGAHLFRADLSGVDFSRADLSWANLWPNGVPQHEIYAEDIITVAEGSARVRTSLTPMRMNPTLCLSCLLRKYP